MIRAALVLLAAVALSGCATYSVEPFFDAGAGKIICCRAVVTNSKNIETVNFDAVYSDGTYRIHFVETGVSASATVAAAAIAASDVAAAVVTAVTTLH